MTAATKPSSARLSKPIYHVLSVAASLSWGRLPQHGGAMPEPGKLPTRSRLSALRRFWPLLIVVAAASLAYALGLQRILSLHFLGEQQQALRAHVGENPVLAAAAFLGIYVGTVALSLPGAVILTLAGGLLFGTVAGAALAVAGATSGAVLLFLAARSALGGWLAGRAGGLLDRIRPGLERDGFSYLLALRLLPVVPFWLVNLAAALVGMRLGSFVLGTLLGIIPATAVFASVGDGLGSVLEAGRDPDLSILLRPAVIGPLLALAILALLPVAWRHWKAARG